MLSPSLQPEHPETGVGGLEVQGQPGPIGHNSQKQSEGREEKGEKNYVSQMKKAQLDRDQP